MSAADDVALVGDLGATNARFALRKGGAIEALQVLQVADHPDLVAAVRAYCAAAGIAMPRRAALAVPCPVTGDRVAFTNHPWSFSIAAARDALGVRDLAIINDLTAVALAIPLLTPDDLVAVGGGRATPDAPIGVIGPGTGLGVSGLVPAGGRWIPLAAEGGHATMAPADDRESAVLAFLRGRFAHVSAERVLSGQGIVNLHQALCGLDGATPEPLSAEEISERALAADDPRCIATIAMFCAMLGAVAGNLALTLGARGGVYIAGGIVPKLLPLFLRSAFRERFLAKDRMRAYLEPIPTFVITREVPGLLGLGALLDGHAGRAALA